MKSNEVKDHLVADIEEKYKLLGVNHETYLRGLLQLKPLTYWDYTEVETLLSLQKPRTDFKDEEVFITYHQVTELVLKLILHELRQLTTEKLTHEKILAKTGRMIRYTHTLINSFDIMKEGIDYDEYNIFRCALAPASGFQSAQFRYIEIHCTRLQNLVNEEGKKRLPEDPGIGDYFRHIYWRDAGTNRMTHEKTLTLKLFEEKYLDDFMTVARRVQGRTLEEIVLAIPDPSPELTSALREFDYLYNVKWPCVHLETASYFLTRKEKTVSATGGSKWKEYLHPKFQQRRFFPGLWSAGELAEWGKN